MVVSIRFLDQRRFKKWFSGLAPQAIARVTKALNKLEKAASSSSHLPGDVRALGEGLYELRVHERPGYRIYFFRKDDSIYVVGFGTKRTQQADIHGARQLKKHYEARGAETSK
ncbi:MAG: type II toxin-antitoxin system RelE/ParE family toxin, partial [Rhodothalassiaceae bacterium]